MTFSRFCSSCRKLNIALERFSAGFSIDSFDSIKFFHSLFSTSLLVARRVSSNLSSKMLDIKDKKAADSLKDRKP